MTAPRTEPRVRATPRISANKLGEYLLASAARRRRIIIEQKHPRAFITARYEDALRAISDAIRAREAWPEVLDGHAKRIQSKVSTSEHDAQNKRLSLEAIEAYRSIASGVDLGAFSPRIADPSPPKLVLARTAVSVRPEILLAGVDDRGLPALGAVKLCFSKAAAVKREAAQYVASLLHYYLEAVKDDDEAKVARERCLVIDVFGKKATFAPKAFKQRREDINAACEEIAARWSSL